MGSAMANNENTGKLHRLLTQLDTQVSSTELRVCRSNLAQGVDVWGAKTRPDRSDLRIKPLQVRTLDQAAEYSPTTYLSGLHDSGCMGQIAVQH
ncbi:hypothetical protein SAMN04488074_13131 [Lentzea albidocapillata subsp. violacea]|uniref:Uncharacterized protein n=1 Tax=Lentzea albidocapillata subsp. violacea TaxID=128104 RepID=A0A1G9XTG5_9PSEU|nr:hypothetical protein [Lentzea albidocapillata]SDM99771.1 hypothetical protein SAMN04488074_13131 [Lentzea albidocapillata subsp. violacea]